MRFRFTIRDLLWLTAMALGWWLDHDKTIQQRDRYRIELDKLQRNPAFQPSTF